MAFRCHFVLKYVFILSLARFFCLAFGDNYMKTNVYTPILSATKMFIRFVVSGGIRFIG